MPKEVFAHATSAFSWSTDERRIDVQARPPIVGLVVNCIAVDWLLNRKFWLKWQFDADAHTNAIFLSTLACSSSFAAWRGRPSQSASNVMVRSRSASWFQSMG